MTEPLTSSSLPVRASGAQERVVTPTKDRYVPEGGDRIIAVCRDGSWIEETPGGCRMHSSFPEPDDFAVRASREPQKSPVGRLYDAKTRIYQIADMIKSPLLAEIAVEIDRGIAEVESAWRASASPSDDGARQPPLKHLTDEITAAHQALDKLNAPKTKTVPTRDYLGKQEITIGLEERIAALPAAASDDGAARPPDFTMSCSVCGEPVILDHEDADVKHKRCGAARPQPAQEEIKVGQVWSAPDGRQLRVAGLSESQARIALRNVASNRLTYMDRINFDASQKWHLTRVSPPTLSSSSLADSPTWQDIATAPKDGTRFLGAWTHQLYGWMWDGCRWYTDANYPGGGYFCALSGGDPTHWMALPNPPSASCAPAGAESDIQQKIATSIIPVVEATSVPGAKQEPGA